MLTYPEFKYVEGAYIPKGQTMTRHIVMNLAKEPPYGLPDLTTVYHGEADIYASIFRYEDVKAVTARHWKGKAIGDFFADIDASDQDHLNDALLFTRKFMSELSQYVPALYIRARFSGSKGFHVEVPFEAFGAQPSDMIHLNYKYIAKVISEAALKRPLEKGERLPDMGRYSIRQLWRLINTQNQKSGLFKIPLYPKELMEMSISNITELARSPRDIGEETCPGIVESASKLYLAAVRFHAGLQWWMQK